MKIDIERIVLVLVLRIKIRGKEKVRIITI